LVPSRVETVTIIDVGARDGFHPRWNQLGNNLRIILFEPDTEGYKDLLEIYKNDERVKIYNAALSDNDSNITIHVASFPYSSSAFKHDETFFSNLNFRELYKTVGTVNIPCKKLEDVVQARFDFIKLDVEGAEIAILHKILEDGTYGLFDRMYVETHETKITGQKEELENIKDTMRRKNVTNIKLNWL